MSCQIDNITKWRFISFLFFFYFNFAFFFFFIHSFCSYIEKFITEKEQTHTHTLPHTHECVLYEYMKRRRKKNMCSREIMIYRKKTGLKFHFIFVAFDKKKKQKIYFFQHTENCNLYFATLIHLLQ